MCFKYGLLTRRILEKNIGNIILNRNIRIHGCNKDIVKCFFPKTEMLLIDYCSSKFIYKNLTHHIFPNLKCLYISSCNYVDFNLLDYPLDSQEIFLDSVCTIGYDQKNNIHIHRKSQYLIYSIWSDYNIELLKL